MYVCAIYVVLHIFQIVEYMHRCYHSNPQMGEVSDLSMVEKFLSHRESYYPISLTVTYVRVLVLLVSTVFRNRKFFFHS